MSNSATDRSLELIEVPSGPSAVTAIWDRLSAALVGDAAIAPIPQESSALPPAVVSAIRDAVDPGRPVPMDTAVVISTSGSTGNPRGVMLTASALTSMTSHVNALAGGDPTWILAIPPTSIGGLNVVVRAKATGRLPVAVSSVGGAERFTDHAFAEAVETAESFDRPIAVSLVPTQLPRLLATDSGRKALARCSLILVGGAALAPQAARDCDEAGITVTTTYGMTETSGGCVLNGVPLPGVDFNVDENDQRISLSGPMLAQGYRDGANEAFGRGWLRTNDRGRWINGTLQVIGRLDDVVSIQGVNVDLLAIEDRLTDHPEIHNVIIVPTFDANHDVRIAMIYTGDEIDPKDVSARITPGLGSIAVPTSFHRVTEFATTASGKVDRRATTQAVGLEPAETDDEDLV
jgi:O-succinylbenzoic acid--CoA ligase